LLLFFVSTYRRPVFTDPIPTFAEHTMPAVGSELDTQFVEFGQAGAHPWSPCYFAVSCSGAPLSISKQHIDGPARPL
jgi:putative transposase